MMYSTGGGGGFGGRYGGGAHGGGAGAYGGAGRGGAGCACGTAPGEECTACGVGCGGDFDVVRPRRDFTCIITGCCLLSLLLLLPLLYWLLAGISTTSLPFDCNDGFVNWLSLWSAQKQEYCCTTTGRGCTTLPTTAFPATSPTVPPTPFPTQPPTPPPTPPPTVPPTPPPTRPPTGDPYNCAVGVESSWGAGKKDWCCRVHHLGCPPTAPPMTLPPMA